MVVRYDLPSLVIPKTSGTGLSGIAEGVLEGMQIADARRRWAAQQAQARKLAEMDDATANRGLDLRAEEAKESRLSREHIQKERAAQRRQIDRERVVGKLLADIDKYGPTPVLNNADARLAALGGRLTQEGIPAPTPFAAPDAPLRRQFQPPTDELAELVAGRGSIDEQRDAFETGEDQRLGALGQFEDHLRSEHDSQQSALIEEARRNAPVGVAWSPVNDLDDAPDGGVLFDPRAYQMQRQQMRATLAASMAATQDPIERARYQQQLAAFDQLDPSETSARRLGIETIRAGAQEDAQQHADERSKRSGYIRLQTSGGGASRGEFAQDYRDADKIIKAKMEMDGKLRAISSADAWQSSNALRNTARVFFFRAAGGKGSQSDRDMEISIANPSIFQRFKSWAQGTLEGELTEAEKARISKSAIPIIQRDIYEQMRDNELDFRRTVDNPIYESSREKLESVYNRHYGDLPWNQKTDPRRGASSLPAGAGGGLKTSAQTAGAGADARLDELAKKYGK